MVKTEFRDVFPCFVSPVADSGELKADVLARLVDHLVSAGGHGLTALGSKGEFAYLSWAQCRRVVEVVLRANAGLKLQGFPVGTPLSPEEPLGPEAREEIRLALKKVKALYAEKNQETSG